MLWFLLAYVLVVAVWAVSRAADRKLVLAAAARPWGGRLHTGWFEPAGFGFEVDGVAASLTVSSDGRGNGRTRVRFSGGVEGRLELRRAGILSGLFESDDLRVGDDAFDRAWIVYGGPAGRVRAMLDASTRARLERLSLRGSGMFRSGGLELRTDADGVSLSVDRCLGDLEAELRAFLDDAVWIFRRFRGPGSEGITWETVSELPAGARCPLCEHPLAGELRRCAKCRTPHHADCWDYFGGCTRYGCGARDGVRASAPGAPASRGAGSSRAGGRGAA